MKEEIAPLCKCGCGERVGKSKRDSRYWNSFISGHNARCQSEETKNKRTAGIQRAWDTGKIKSWNLGKTKGTDKRILASSIKQSESMKGRPSYIRTPESLLKSSISHRNPNETIRKKMSDRQNKLWGDNQYRDNQSKAIIQGSYSGPNKIEIELQTILDNLYPGEWKFVGDGQLIIDGKSPDFVNCNGQKKIIELFGDYWHKGQNPEDRKKVFKPFGYETLVIWEHELKEIKKVKNRISRFATKL